MRIGFVGSGNIGGTLARLFSRAGHEVAVSNSRGPDTLDGLVAELGPGARAVTAPEAAAFGDVVVVAIPYGRFRELPAEPFTGKIVVDADNYYPQRGHVDELDSGKATSTGLLARHLPGARVLKGFNTLYYGNLLERGRPDAPAGDRLAIAIAGDDAEAKAVLTDLVDQLGFTAVDTGALDESWRQEPGTPVFGNAVGPDEATALIAQARRKG
ncbi:MAG TPA: NADPH-dependent F420 reductase [Mycobacteriales bacterium]|nr:NADPH-dependent F420 reductase [Mycobacteriales bacterium]